MARLAVRVAVLGTTQMHLLVLLRARQQAVLETRLQHLQVKATLAAMVGHHLA
jgi:hypothetical protein